MASFSKFDCFVADLANKVHNLGSDALKIMLTNTGPVQTNTVKANITEISAGNGYSAGGLAVTGITSTQSSGLYKLVASADPSFTASGAVGPFQYAVLYNSTPASGNLIGWWDRGSTLTLANTDTFTVDLDQVAGILQLS
jgi:hypothetical protein